MPHEYDKVILAESGFIVELSNRGKKPKNNPNPLNFKRNLIKCCYLGCNEQTKNKAGLCTKHKKEKVQHTTDWIGRLIPPRHTREDCLVYAPPHSQMIDALIGWADNKESRKKILDDFISDIIRRVHTNVPDATTLQKNLEQKESKLMSADDVAKLIKGVVDKHFPENNYNGETLNFGRYKSIELNNLPVRVAAAILMTGVTCEEINRGDAWFCKAHGKVPEYANIYMPLGYYYLRKAGAPPKQAKMALKG